VTKGSGSTRDGGKRVISSRSGGEHRISHQSAWNARMEKAEIALSARLSRCCSLRTPRSVQAAAIARTINKTFEWIVPSLESAASMPREQREAYCGGLPGGFAMSTQHNVAARAWYGGAVARHADCGGVASRSFEALLGVVSGGSVRVGCTPRRVVDAR
jgi:hypothetical protein